MMLDANFVQTVSNGYGVMQSYAGHHRLHTIEGDHLTCIVFGFDSLWRNGNHEQDRPVAGVSHQISGMDIQQSLSNHRIYFLVPFTRRRIRGHARQGAIVSGKWLHDRLRIGDLLIILSCG
ncbi:protein of unknown function [Acidithiobacillus ferrivorans]|uniref:Uncharacterized protein n=1 Tax=Acidithiobacillus ferrivorans TaxID=160808 RepID=A0A060UV44_9PROT|nr:hypothetical protein AFERRI_400424 [Acidithiobacillus ferrivorans]SMH64672.1 protein of unknown function [Acidithiobacillus ferrivorans]